MWREGLRLRPLTNDIPKPLVLIDKKPILEHIINHFLKFNYNNLLLQQAINQKKLKNSCLKNS